MPTRQGIIKELLGNLYPGDGGSVALVRNEVERIVTTPGPGVVLLQGAPGTGKTTMARTIAVCRRILLGSPSGPPLTFEGARTEILSQKPLTWYRDISLAGLVENLAEAQLFGVGEGVATGVTARVGVFEQAMTGCDPSERSKNHAELLAAAKRNKRWAPLVTGGVVLLDEIGDLAISLQGKLLRVLNGEKQYRLGTEGHNAYAFEYCGITVLATWRDISAMKDFRQDLWQRIRNNRIPVPSLSAYSKVNLQQIIRSIHQEFRNRAKAEIERLDDLAATSEEEICSPDWLTHLAHVSKQRLSLEVEIELSELDIKAIGEFRGLRSVINRVINGSSIDEAVERTIADSGSAPDAERILQENDIRIFGRVLQSESPSIVWKESRSEWAKRVNALLIRHDPQIESMISSAGKPRATIKKQIENLLRSKSRED